MTPCQHKTDGGCQIICTLADLSSIPLLPETCVACNGVEPPRAVNEVTTFAASRALRAFWPSERAARLMHEHINFRDQRTCPKPPPDRPPTRLAKLVAAPGVGSQIWRLLSSIGVRHTSDCPCLEWAERLNGWGPHGCRLARAEIVERLKTARKDYGWQKSIMAAARAVTTGLVWRLNPLDPYGSLVDEAIRLAEEAERAMQGVPKEPSPT